jgi:membrane peptidoglycan carboxypeptidase
VSSRADDFDVRYRDAGNGRPGGHGTAAGSGVPGVYGATIDYDLGYGEQGFDTQGFRSPEVPAGPDVIDAGFPSGQGPSRLRPGNGRTGSHARATAARDTGQLQREPETLGRSAPLLPDGPYRNVPLLPDGPQRGRRRGGPSGPGPSGPGAGGPGGPGGKVKGSWWRHWTLRKALGVLAAFIGAFIVLGAIGIAVLYEETPVPTEAMEATSYTQSEVLSADGTLIGRFGTTDRQMLSLNQIPQNLIDAVLAAEDRNFYNEGGISPEGIIRASYEDLMGGDGSLQGGSTITQEFVRNYYVGIGTQQTLSRKIKEIFVSLKVGKEKSKQWILTNYLNTIFLGDGAYGVGAAAQTYFDIPPSKLKSELTTAQAAVIAAIIQQPSTYPLQQYRAQLVARWRYVLSGMVQTGDLTAQQAAAMKFPGMGDHIPQTFGKDVWDPYILDMVKNELEDVYGFSQSQIDDGGYTIRTSIDDAQMQQLYDAVIDNEATINDSADPMKYYMHVGAVLENPATGAIEALYPGPGFVGWPYNGIGPKITAKECKKIFCQVNMAVYNREQVGSSFKPYILSLAVKQGMNVQTSTLDGYDNLCIPPDGQPTTYPVTATVNPATLDLECQNGWYGVANDDLGENGPYTPQAAMAESINTAYADLWHVVAGPDGQNVVNMAQAFGVDTALAGITAGPIMEDEAGVALGQASLTVTEQATMLATIDDYGVYHDAHVITSITRNGVQTPVKIATDQVFSTNPQLNEEEATQVQYAMSEDTTIGTAPTAAMSNGQEIIAKTGTTNTAQSAFFIGAIPRQTLAVALFTSKQNGQCTRKSCQTLNNLGDVSEGGYGGTWPAAIWHTFAENVFVPMGVEQFNPVVFTGTQWNLVPPNLRHPAKPKNNKKKGSQGGNPTGQPSAPPNPYPTYSCDPTFGACQPNPNPTPTFSVPPGPGQNAAASAAAVGGVFTALPVTCLWVRRRTRKRGRGRG